MLVYVFVAGRLERTPFSGALVFTGIGLLLGPIGLGVLDLGLDNDGLKLLAELTLALVLFVEAAATDLAVLRRAIAMPSRRPTALVYSPFRKALWSSGHAIN